MNRMVWCPMCVEGETEHMRCCGEPIGNVYGNPECCGDPEQYYEKCELCDGTGEIDESDFFMMKLRGEITGEPRYCDEHPRSDGIILWDDDDIPKREY